MYIYKDEVLKKRRNFTNSSMVLVLCMPDILSVVKVKYGILFFLCRVFDVGWHFTFWYHTIRWYHELNSISSHRWLACQTPALHPEDKFVMGIRISFDLLRGRFQSSENKKLTFPLLYSMLLAAISLAAINANVFTYVKCRN